MACRKACRKMIVSKLLSLGLFMGVAAIAVLLPLRDCAKAQMPMESTPSGQSTQFRRLEQPLGLKIGVIAGGTALIGLELWWFLFSKNQSRKAETKQGVQEVNITVDGGYDPSQVVVRAGQPVRLNFFRKDPSSCLETVLVPDFHIARDLRLNQVTSVEFTPEKPGEYPFTCGMNMFRGLVEVKAAAVAIANG